MGSNTMIFVVFKAWLIRQLCFHFCGHFRSGDKNGGQTIRSATAENPLQYANCTALSFIEPELLPIEVLHCGNREFCASRKGRRFRGITSSEPWTTKIGQTVCPVQVRKKVKK